MTLRDYLTRRRETMQAFGARIGTSRISVARYAAGLRLPDREVMRRIVEATGGAVTPNDFFGVTGTPEATAKGPLASRSALRSPARPLSMEAGR